VVGFLVLLFCIQDVPHAVSVRSYSFVTVSDVGTKGLRSKCDMVNRALIFPFNSPHHLLTTGGPGSVPAQVCMGFEVDKVALGQVLSHVLQYFLTVSFYQCSLHVHPSVSDGVLSLQLTALLNNTCKWSVNVLNI